MKYALCGIKNGSGKESLFTYSIPIALEDQISPGSLVMVPFRNKEIEAVVFDFCQKPTFKTREILKVSELHLPPYFVDLASWLAKTYGASLSQALRTMLPFSYFKKRREKKKESPNVLPQSRFSSTLEQKKIVEDILGKRAKPHLLFGVTGSGKTQIYLEVLEKIIKEGGQGLILIPEISLTPQTFSRFQERFPEQVALYHSYLKETDRFKIWQDIANNKIQIIVGSRSALFLPFQKLGLIVLDEEHETSYKQDQSPRYLAGEVAEKISQLTKSILILGSATPLIETFYQAEKGKYYLHQMNKRFIQNQMPETIIIDMKKEFQNHNKSIFSEKLQEEIEKVLQNKRQVVLFINRRGLATFVMCRDCGYVEKCPNCDLPLTYHGNYQEGKLFCHHCNFSKPTSSICPNCKSTAIRYFGKGTQKVEEEVKSLFPKARVRRMDTDSVKNDHDKIYEEFRKKNYDILIGTQMISKGWDLPEIDLVGIISIDQTENLPDFRASERTFSLVTQVSGRTGRGAKRGLAIIQTYNPRSETLKLASQHDYCSFYKKEIKKREELAYPPFSKIIRLEYSDKDQERAKSVSRDLKKNLLQALKNKKILILGPSPAFISKINGLYRWQIILKIDNHENFGEILESVLKYTVNNWKVDINPQGTL